ncbi:MAG: metallophosphoesterase [Bacteroidetes bacterium]|nr:MAG: metallophosphoesterase [Bacteroidota bacterium]
MMHWLFVLGSLLFTSVFLLVQYYLYRRIKRYLKEIKAQRWQQLSASGLFILFNIPLIIIAIWRPRISTLPYWFILTGVMPFYIWHASLFALFFFLMLGKLMKLPVVGAMWLRKKLKSHSPSDIQTEREQEFPYSPERRVLLQRGILLLTGATFTSTIYGTFRRHDYELLSQEIPIKGLPAELNGFTIALTSDVHSSVFMWKARMIEYAQAINSVAADMILVTGDFVTMQVEEVYPFGEAFSILKAPHGVYGVLGNHDFYTRQVDTIAKEVNACGITLLRNNSIKIEKNGKSFFLLGVDDIGTHAQANKVIGQALEHTTDDVPKILMCHRPYFFEVAAKKGVALTLSGHTHGGQVVFFRTSNNVISPARMASPYVSGLYSLGENSLYVNRGLGTVGIPVRINCPPEITKIKLVSA